MAGEIALIDKGQFIQLEATATNKTNLVQSLRYVFSVINNNPQTGYKRDSKGRFIMEPYGQKSLEGPIIQADNTEKLIILLLIYNPEDELLGMDRVVLNGDGTDEVKKIVVRKDAMLQKDDQGIWTIRGLITDDTKTKFGRDFFRYFAEKYRNGTFQSTKVLTVKETFALANTTKIEILLGNQKFTEFVLPPQRDYEIRKIAEGVYSSLTRYFIIQQQNQNQITRY